MSVPNVGNTPTVHHTPHGQNEIADIHYGSNAMAALRSTSEVSGSPTLPISGQGFADAMRNWGISMVHGPSTAEDGTAVEAGPLYKYSGRAYEGQFECHITIGEDGLVSKVEIDLVDMERAHQPLTPEEQTAFLKEVGAEITASLAGLQFEPGQSQEVFMPFGVYPPQ